MIYFCEGTGREKLDWFKTINIAGEKLTNQELRNAIYTGAWLNDAKKYFSKQDCPAWNIGKDYLTGSPIRQDYLETVLKWISGDNIEEYMASSQNKPDANDLWIYFQDIINWFKRTFPEYRKEMKGLDIGYFYNQYKNQNYNSVELENKIKILLQDEDVTKKSGIYPYLLSKSPKFLNIRIFSPNQKRETYQRQNGVCTICSGNFELNAMEADHITPWVDGGKTVLENCQMLCRNCNRTKSSR